MIKNISYIPELDIVCDALIHLEKHLKEVNNKEYSRGTLKEIYIELKEIFNRVHKGE